MSSYAETSLVRGLSWLAEAQAAIAHNLANVDTANFKRRTSVAHAANEDFATVLAARLPTVSYGERTDFRPGNSRETGNRLDVALDGSALFKVRGPDGRQFYTRNGQMQIDVDGYLVTRDGLRYLDQGGAPIQLGNGGQPPADIAFTPNGTIHDPLTGQRWGPLAVVELPRVDALQPAGRGLFVDPLNQRATFAAAALQQGYLEGSNVDSLQEMVQMIAVERSFSATQRALTGVGRMQSSLIQNVSR